MFIEVNVHPMYSEFNACPVELMDSNAHWKILCAVSSIKNKYCSH